MSTRDRRNKGLLFFPDQDDWAEMKETRRLTQEMNTVDRADFDKIRSIVNKLLGKSDETTFINPPFCCDYGSNIFVGKNFFANYNCVILDNAKVTFGDNCMLGPNVSLYTAGHPLHPDIRNTGYEYGMEITIGNNVWIGGNVVICPGVHIGDNSVIGAGSVVTKDIPEWSLALGNPCKVIRRITEEDKKYYYRNKTLEEGRFNQ
ncbi:MAG: sugar O-acetyltransferase [Ruminococcaceae bacterium]|nr:sugar O-acetyltransferase [Oscillospiraceae bacterium]